MPVAETYSSRLSELLEGICDVPAKQDVSVMGIQMDSRNVQAGDLFIAVAGSDFDASRYVNDAIENGAKATFIDSEAANESLQSNKSAINLRVADLKQHSGLISDRFFRSPSRDMLVTGVTGTNGKTSVSCYLAEALNNLERPSGVIGTLGFGLIGDELVATNYTTPNVVEVHRCLAKLRDAGAKAVVMEVSSHGLEQGRVDGVRFAGGIFTNLTRDHLDYHGTMEAYAAAKGKLFSRSELDFAVLNADDPYTDTYLDIVAGTDVRCFTFGIESKADITATNIVYADGIQATVVTPLGCFELKSTLLGKFNLSNLLAVLGGLIAMNASLDELQVVNTIKPVSGRMQMVTKPGMPLVLVDYAHTPDALKNVLVAANQHCKGRISVVFGCGGDRDKGKRAEMARIAEQHAQKIFVTDDNPRSEKPESIVANILEGFSDIANVKVEHDRAIAISEAITQSQAEDVVVIAGKGHENYQEINGARSPFSDEQVVNDCLDRLLKTRVSR